MMLQAFPSARSSITSDSPKVYLFAVEEFQLEALRRACRAIVRGEIADLKPDFPPSAPKLAQIVKEFEGKLQWEAYEAQRQFIEQDSVLWEKLKLLRNDHSPAAYERTMPDGRRCWGWYFDRAEVKQAEMLELPAPASAEAVKALMGKLAFSAGDPEGEADAA